MEATAIGSYVMVCRYLFDWLFLKQTSKDQANSTIKEYMYKIERFILLHYAHGSKFNTEFWKHAQKMYREIPTILKNTHNGQHGL